MNEMKTCQTLQNAIITNNNIIIPVQQPVEGLGELLEVQREDEFSPIKHTGGNEASLLTAQRDLSQLYAGWLRAAYPELPEGVGTERGPAVEISPLFAMDAEELKEKLELPLPETTGGILLGGRA